ncbi:hypothetical protein [Streptomyces sp. NPDC058463]|uniref:hypothetical protein n=1 Tax=Streptomyces sp. NPDC058463 TaxID=3346510 RepID=UPI003659DD09
MSGHGAGSGQWLSGVAWGISTGAYEKEHPRAGEADLVTAKHRNGLTARITVGFQGHYSRFEMAKTRSVAPETPDATVTLVVIHVGLG